MGDGSFSVDEKLPPRLCQLSHRNEADDGVVGAQETLEVAGVLVLLEITVDDVEGQADNVRDGAIGC